MNTLAHPPVETGTACHRVFIVDDHPFVRDWLASFVSQQAGFAVCGQAGTASEAYEQMTLLKPEVAVVDLSLRGETAFDLIKRLQSLSPSPRVLVLSMHDEVFYAERALRAGALGYVMKHEHTDKIMEGLQHVLSGRLYVSEQLAKVMAQKFVGSGLRPGATPVETLGDREFEVFRLIGLGHDNKRIAEELHLSIKTVQAHCEHIKEKLALENMKALVREAVRWVETEHRA